MKGLIVTVALIAIFFVGRSIYFKPKFMIGVEAPQFEADLKDGGTFSLNEALNENWILLDFWGSWCGPCRQENPNLVKLYNEFHGKEFDGFSDFDIVSVSIETREESWKQAIIKDGLIWKNHIVQLDRFKSPIPMMYGIKEIPTTYLINTEGRIVGVNMTYEELQLKLNDQLANK